MSQSRRLILASVAAFLILVLCAFFAAGGYLVGRQTMLASQEQSVPALAQVDGNSEGQTSSSTESAIEPVAPATEPTQQPTESEPLPEDPVAQNPPADQPAVQEEQVNREPVQLTEDDLAYLNEAWSLVNQQYDGQLPDRRDVLYGALMGSLDLLDDDFTRFYTPEMAAGFRESLQGRYEGVGAIVDLTEDGFLVVVRVIRGGPGERVGLLNDDVVTHVDGQSIQGLQLDEIIAQVKGPRGTAVTLTVDRESAEQPVELTIVRDVVEIPIVESEMLDNDIAYVSLTGFSSNAREQLEAALVELLAQNPQGLILDLRDNPGGFLNQSVAVADLFLTEGVVLYERDGVGGEEETFRSTTGDIAEAIPMVVLVNAQSASASEIVAGALQDRGRAVILGEITFGKGSVQQTNNLSDGAELRVTIARWYTPDNQSINGAGITPDIEVETPTEYLTEADGQLQRAIEYLLTGQ